MKEETRGRIFSSEGNLEDMIMNQCVNELSDISLSQTLTSE